VERVATPVREIRHPTTDELDLTTILRTVGDPVRLAIVRLVAREGEMPCGPISDAVGIPSSTSSYHLRLLREAGVTRTRAAGTERHISLRREDLDERFPGLVALLTRD
jgi:DNA-binding transcriptional ArsR family regulator